MKKVLWLIVCLMTMVVSVNAQIIQTEELEKYAKEKYGEKWVDAAYNLGTKLSLDKNNALTYVQVIPCDGKTKEQLYVLLNYWFTSTFVNANAAIKLNDKELGTIIANGYIGGVATHVGGINAYEVSIEPIIKCDIKDEKVRITYTVPYYTVVRNGTGGWFGTSMRASRSVRFDEKWMLDNCYPFATKDRHKKTSSKALIMAHAYSNVVMDKIEECLKNGLVGNEVDGW